MKKFFAILILGFIAFAVYTKSWQTEQNIVEQKSVMLDESHLTVFSQKACSHCHHALGFINEKIKPVYPVTVDVLDIAEQQNFDLLISVAEKRQLGDQIGTPILIIGDKTLIGWSAKTEMELVNTLEAIYNKPVP